MASRKEQKDQARAARLAKEQAAAVQTQRKRRLQIFGGVIVVAVIVIVVAIVVSTSGGGSSKTGLQTGTQESATVKTVNAELKGIPESGTTLGSPSAKVTLTYFGDLQCPICADFTTTPGYLPAFIKADVKTGIAKITYRSLCTATCNDFPQSLFTEQQTDAYAAGKQGKFWYYAELFYRQQGTEGSPYVNSAFLDGLARQIPGLDYSTWASDRTLSALRATVVNDEADAQNKYGFSATPSFLITGPKGTSSLGSSVLSVSELQQAVKAVQ